MYKMPIYSRVYAKAYTLYYHTYITTKYGKHELLLNPRNP